MSDTNFTEGVEAPLNEKVETGHDNPGVISAIKLMGKSQLIREVNESEWDAIEELFQLGFEVSDPSGQRKIESQLLWKALYKVVSKMKPLDATIHGTGASEDMERVVTSGIATVMDEGGFDESLRDKFGAFYRMVLFGDAFIRVGTDNQSDYPIKFQNTSLLSIYTDPYAVNLRSPSSENDCDELLAVYKYSWDEAIKLYPELAKKGGLGLIQNLKRDKNLTHTQDQLDQQEREVEIGHYYNLSSKRYTVFAGTARTVLIDDIGDEYPFIKKGQAYIPFIHLMCFPSSEGFYNKGIGHVLYKLAILARQLNNRAINYSFDNVDPIRIVNVPQGQSAQFFNKLLTAEEARAKGRKGIVVQEYSATDPRGGQQSLEAFKSEPLTQEWERLFNWLVDEVAMLGINLRAVDRGTSVTATQIIAEEENQDQFVKQIMEQNSGEFKFAYELTIEMIKEFISKTNKTPINMTTRINIEGADARVQGITLGMLSDELKSKNYFVKVNSRSGAIPSNVFLQAQISRAMSVTAPGTPAFNKLAVKMMNLNDQDISMEDLGGGQEAGGQPQGDIDVGGFATETDELAPAAKPSETIPAIG